MKYRDLLSALQQMNEEQLNCDVTMEFDGELYPAHIILNYDDRLDIGHPVVTLDDY